MLFPGFPRTGRHRERSGPAAFRFPKIETEHAERVCKCFVNLGLGELGDRGCKTGREFRLHGLQLSHSMGKCETTLPDPTFPISFRHERLSDGLVTIRRGRDLGGAATETSPVTPTPHASQSLLRHSVELVRPVRSTASPVLCDIFAAWMACSWSRRTL
jgi:hypothetical protein